MRSAPLAVLCLFGCASLELKKIDLSARPPSNVVVYFTVDRSPGGDPVPGLTADKFRITENNRKLSPVDTQQTLLDRRLVATNDVLVLVDMSRAMTKSKALAMLDSAIDNFVLKLGTETTVGVYAFDGGEDIVPIIPLPTATQAGKPKAPPGENPRLIDFEQRDPSANLHGAVRVALETLTDALEKAPKPLHFGSLVVISAGPDRADRVSQAKMLKAIQRASKLDLFAIGLGADIDKDEIKQIGRTFTVLEPELPNVKRQLDAMADRLLQRARRFYLLSYCSPARRGKRQLKIEATAADGASGTLETKFDAEGFGPKCDPEKEPSFEKQAPPAEEEKPEEEPPPPRKRKKSSS
jgi:hypothetical protein